MTFIIPSTSIPGMTLLRAAVAASKPHAAAADHHDRHEEQAEKRKYPKPVEVGCPTEVHDLLLIESAGLAAAGLARPRCLRWRRRKGLGEEVDGRIESLACRHLPELVRQMDRFGDLRIGESRVSRSRDVVFDARYAVAAHCSTEGYQFALARCEMSHVRSFLLRRCGFERSFLL